MHQRSSYSDAEEKFSSKSKVGFKIHTLTELITVSVNGRGLTFQYTTAHSLRMATAGIRMTVQSSPWSRGPILPPSMVDILQKEDIADKSDEEDRVNDYEELLAYLDDDEE